MKVATLVIIVAGDKVLLGKKKRGEIGTDTLNGPGGKQEKGETLIECALRETKEEADITLDPEQLEKVGIVDFYAGDELDFRVHVYRTEIDECEPTETDDMVTDWYPKDNLPFAEMLEADRDWFRRAACGEKFCANVFYQKRASGYEGVCFKSFMEEMMD